MSWSKNNLRGSCSLFKEVGWVGIPDSSDFCSRALTNLATSRLVPVLRHGLTRVFLRPQPAGGWQLELLKSEFLPSSDELGSQTFLLAFFLKCYS